MTSPARDKFCDIVDCDDLGDPGDVEREERLSSSLIGSRLGWISTAGLGTVDVRSIQSGRISGFASDCTSESSSVDETVMYTIYPLLSRSTANERVKGSWKLEQARTTISFLAPFANFFARLFLACALLRLCISTAVVPTNATHIAITVRFRETQASVFS